MKYILIFILSILQTICLAVVNAKTFGAKGDGIQNDAPHLNGAIAKALSLGEDLFIPSGTYKCIQSGSDPKIVRMDQPGVKKITIFGEAGTKITTEQPSGCLFYIYNKNTNVTVKDIFFENTHGITMNQTNALQLSGTNSNSIQNFTIQNCRFEGFSTAISAQGVRGLLIQNNVFESPRGHDNAQNNSQPAVYIWLADNANGQCFDVKILNNQVNGYTGKDITNTTTKRPMDGFVFGIAYGILIKGNIIRNLSEEHIALQPHNSFTDSKDSVLITENKFYQLIPPGSMKEGAPLLSNYGVRTDCNNVTISNNDFYDYTIGVLIYPLHIPTLKLHNYKISSNRFYSPNSKLYNVTEAIKIQSNPANPVDNITISDNTITIEGIQLKSNRSVISIYDCTKVNILNNTISGQNINLNGYSLDGILTKGCMNVVNKPNILNFK
jgi:hypothetical protein